MWVYLKRKHNKCKLIETGEFRIPKVGEIYLGRNGGFLNFLDRYAYKEKILKPANKRSQRIMDKTIKELYYHAIICSAFGLQFLCQYSIQ